MTRPAEDIHAAAQQVIKARFAHGVSTHYVMDILEQIPGWRDAPMDDFEAVRVEVKRMLGAYVDMVCPPRLRVIGGGEPA